MELKDLKALLKVLKANGVTQYASPELSLTLTEQPAELSLPEGSNLPEEQELTEEELLFYSAEPRTESQ